MKSLEAKVGAFVVASALILCATIYSVSVARFSGAHVQYRTYLRNAAGMEPGTAVLFGGITVGKVTAVQPDKLDPTRIEISIDVKQSTPLNASSVAEVGTVSLMSSPVLSISTGSNDAVRLQPGSIIPSHETLSLDELQNELGTLAATAQKTLVSVGGNLDNVTGDTRSLLGNLNALTGDANRDHVAHVLASTDSMVTQLSPQLQKISDQTVQLTERANRLAAKMDPTVDNVNATVTNANETITSIRQPSQADLEELQKTLVDTRALIASLQSVVQANAQNTTYTLENLRMATENLNELTESVKERPWSLVRIKQPKDRAVPKQGGNQ